MPLLELSGPPAACHLMCAAEQREKRKWLKEAEEAVNRNLLTFTGRVSSLPLG